jgi:hypothetical protein
VTVRQCAPLIRDTPSGDFHADLDVPRLRAGVPPDARQPRRGAGQGRGACGRAQDRARCAAAGAPVPGPVSARLAGVEPPSHPDEERSFAELQARIASTRAFIEGLDAAAFEGSEAREIVLRAGTPKEKRYAGEAYLLAYGLPQFFFHVTTAYALLRHNGVEIGKRDFMGLG